MTNAQQRRASGQAMTNSRTGKSQVDELNSVVNAQKTAKTLKTISPRGALPAQKGTGNYQAPAATSGGGGVAGPLTETVDSRTYFTEKSAFYTNDFLLLVEVQPLKQMTMRDANGDDVIFDFKAPPTDV